MAPALRIALFLAALSPCAAQLPDSSGSTTILERDHIAAYPLHDVTCALLMAPGLALPLGHGFAAGPHAVALSVDGVAAIDAESGLADWSLLPLVALERIEVTRTLDGRAAVNLVTARDRRALRLEAAATGIGTVRSEGYASLAVGPVSATLFGSYLHDEGVRQHSEGSSASIGAVVGYAPTGSLALRLATISRWSDFEQPGGLVASQLSVPTLSSPFFRFDERESGRHRATASFTWRPLEALDVAGSLGGEWRSGVITETLPITARYADTRERTFDARGWQGALEASTRLPLLEESNRLRIGLGVRADRFASSYRSVRTGAAEHYYTGTAITSEPDPPGVAGRLALSASARLETAVIEPIRVSVGAVLESTSDRIESIDSTSTAKRSLVRPHAGVRARYVEAAGHYGELFGSVAAGGRLATLDELGDLRPIPTSTAPYSTMRSNMALEPERSLSYEAGLRHAYRSRDGLGADCSIAVYRTDTEGEIALDGAAMQMRNGDPARHEGVELGVRVDAGEALRLFASYGRQEARRRDDGRRLAGIPNDIAALGASYRHASGLGGALVARGIGSYPLDDTRLRTIEARLTVDGRIEYRYGGATLSVEVFNLFDAAGVTSGTVDPSGSGVALYDPAPGRSVFATVRIEL